MSRATLSTRRPERENQIITHIFERAFPDAEIAGVPEGKNFFAVNVSGYIYKVEVKEVGQKVEKGG